MTGHPVETAYAREMSAVTIHSTANCVNTPAVLFALEEAGAIYSTVTVEDGWFSARFGIPGPGYEESAGDEKWMLVEVSAILRHVARAHAPGSLWPSEIRRQAEVDRWVDFLTRRIGRAAESMQSTGDPAPLLALLRHLEAQIAAHSSGWLVGEFSIADVTAARLLPFRAKLPLAMLPRLGAYLERLVARPAYARGNERAK
jgi:glutathione S-transferase